MVDEYFQESTKLHGSRTNIEILEKIKKIVGFGYNSTESHKKKKNFSLSLINKPYFDWSEDGTRDE